MNVSNKILLNFGLLLVSSASCTKACLISDKLPEPTEDCDYCGYWLAVKIHIDKYSIH